MIHLAPVYRLGATRYYDAIESYAEARKRADLRQGPVYVDVGRGHATVAIAELPAEPFTLHTRHGDVIRMQHALGGRLHPGDGRGRGHGAARRGGLIPVDASWVMVNFNADTAAVVTPRQKVTT